jgi:hypothetical protein
MNVGKWTMDNNLLFDNAALGYPSFEFEGAARAQLVFRHGFGNEEWCEP